ncbi:MAG: hypothetical protein RBG13Loki_2355 [Promethearchaeota archaeon CR_4]|nr:MAG: hypothetical protein RBG13Loki_2355 [Candidatus Lokiarchaeota archaeon CR_4]
MPEKSTENLVLLLDSSRSMFRRDYAPNRFEAAKKVITTFVQTRLKTEAGTQIALVTFGSKVTRVLDFINIPETILSALDEIELGGKSPLGDGLGVAVQILIGELRKVGARVPRILLISDGQYTNTAIDPVRLAKLCSGLNIYIDVIRLGAMEHFNIMKKIAQMTNGQFFYGNDVNDLIAIATKLAKNPTSAATVFDKEDARFAPLLAQIAGNLLKVGELTSDQKSLIDSLLGKNASKCIVCFSVDDPITKAPFYISGRYCPNCNQPMHINCAAMWAEQDGKRTSSEIFRCPHCFYLLRIPAEAHKTRQLHKLMRRGESEPPSSEQSDNIIYTTRGIAKDFGDRALFSACPVCLLIFEENDKVVSCGNAECNALYHENCFLKLEESRCKKCGLKMQPPP